MKFRYFIVSGKAKEAYDIIEIMQITQEDARNKFLKANKVKRIATGGFSNNVTGLIFEDGVDIPDGFTKPDKWDCVRPKAKGDDAKWWREQLKTLNVKSDCAETLCKFIKGPTHVLGEYIHNKGTKSYSTRSGYVGDKLIVEVPVSNDGYKKAVGLKEIPAWKFEKMCQEFAESGIIMRDHYSMQSRFYDYSQPEVKQEEKSA